MEISCTSEEELMQPMSPMSQYVSSSVLTLTILGVLEFEVPINDLPAYSLIQNVFLSINPRFSSVMVTDEKGVKRWKKTEVSIKDHIRVPVFPPNKSPEFYNKCFDDYMSEIGLEALPLTRPLWEIHIVEYPTSNAAGTLIFKLHHALGDGLSIMGALLSCLQRADNPSLPLTFPSVKMHSNGGQSKKNVFKKIPKIFSSVYNTVSDFCGGVLMSTIMEDDRTPIRSKAHDVEFQPMTTLTMTFSLDQVKQIKSKLGATVNDVITGVIFLGTRLYMQEMCHESRKSRSTALVLLNTRMTKSYRSVDDMLKPNAEGPWGNLFSFLQIPLPKLTHANLTDPLQFVVKARRIIKRKRNSIALHMTSWLLQILNKHRGPEVVSKFVYGTLKNSSLGITNIVGAQEKMALSGHPVKGIYFMVFGSPEDVVFGIVSYMGILRVSMGVGKEFIDAEKFKTHIENAFEMIFKAACGNKKKKKKKPNYEDKRRLHAATPCMTVVFFADLICN
ncbi:O-acyltransferase WSD1-like [Tripterygium wilfordii]|uniref:O-acyltransferase WSD1-like n=1 Tax=Tripterygium wilfordii TaxID=458696 RepID=UPI0018F807D9|nr:O-acyltransferase WSD1-like [Tripterygium wilfordii]